MKELDTLIEQLPRTVLVVGKGGVGKTTNAVRIATELAARGSRTLLLSTDPAAALADVLGAPVSTHAAAVSGHERLDARQLSAPELRQEFLARWRDVIAEIVDRGTYLDRSDVDGLVDAALPGVDEVFALLALADLVADARSPYEHIVVDTAPTGHTLRLLALPDTFRALLSMLELMQGKHQFMVRALTHRYRRDRADEFLYEMRRRIDRLRETLANGDALAAVLVTRVEVLVEAESARYLKSLEALHVRVAAVILNAVRGEPPELTWIDSSIPGYVVPYGEPAKHSSSSTKPTSAADFVPPASAASLARTLTIVGGKGGVGKTTVACALAIAAVDADGAPTLLVSTDPAPSIADAFGETRAAWAHADVEHAVTDAPGLVVRQMDATAAFARVRDEYQTRIDALFDSIVGRGVDVSQDRAILRDLLALAPPGIDELFALSLLGDTIAEGRFARVIVDPAPTGHLLRLLEMPSVALDWTHRLMRLMLKYRDVVELGGTAQELLDFAKRTRALDTLLHDRERGTLIVVALDEPVVRAETVRLAAAVEQRGVQLGALIWNRAVSAPFPLPDTRFARQLFAEEISPPPVGLSALRAWSQGWRERSAHIASE